ncbi:MAG: flippase-like domain-containing protein [Rubellimicrobium sp.]|nr:flippase-like domain-containing protein [Rubellimicrobium sp.]
MSPALSPPARWRAIATIALRLGLPLALLALVWRLADGPAAAALLRSADALWLVAALVAAHLQILLSAQRWRMTAGALGQRITVGRATAEYYLSQLVNLTLPAGVLGDAGRAIRMRHAAGMIPAGQAVVIERMAGQIALFAVLLAGLVMLAFTPDAIRLPDWGPTLVLGLIGVGAALAGAVVLLRRRSGALAQAAAGFAQAARTALMSRRLVARQAALSLVIVAANLATVSFCARATGTALPLVAVLVLVPLMLLTMLLPVAPGGWGLREGAAAVLWPLAGASAAAGIAASIAFGLVILCASLPGLLVLLAPAPGQPPGT